MEGSTGEVVQGSQLADQAGQALGEIESVSERLADLIQSISHASKQQAHSSESLSKAMSEIAAVTQRTAAGTKQATARSTTWRDWPTNCAIPSVPSNCLLLPTGIATVCDAWREGQHMHRIFPLTWSFRTQLGVLTLATAVVSVLGTWLIGCPTPALSAHPLLLVALLGMAGLACSLLWSLMQQGNRQVLNRRAH